MRVLLVVPSLDVPKFKGLAKVSKALADELPKHGIETEVLEVHKKRKKYLRNITTTPLKELLSRSDIIHATTPESGTFLPFMFWKKSVVTFHDFIPFEMSERLKFKFKFLASLYSKFIWGLSARNKVLSQFQPKQQKILKDILEENLWLSIQEWMKNSSR